MTTASCAELLAAAIEAAGRGWPVFPLWPNTKKPALHRKDRCPRTGPCTQAHQGWEQRATTDADIIGRCWQRPFNIGVAIGPAGPGRHRPRHRETR